MALLYPRLNDAKTVLILSNGITYASSIHWQPTNDFKLNVVANHQIMLLQQNTDWIAVYYGPITVRIRTEDFKPDIFIVDVKPRGLGIKNVNVPPHRRDSSPGFIQDYYVQQHKDDLDKLKGVTRKP